MEISLLLVKSVTLLYRESQLTEKTENSSDLVRNVISEVGKESSSVLLKPKQILNSLRDMALDMCNNPIDHDYSVREMLQRIKLITDGDDNLYNSLADEINTEIPENQLKRSIVNLRKSLNNHFKEKTVSDIFSKASYEMKFQREKIKDINTYITEIIGQLEPLQISTTAKDSAVMDDIDIGDDNALNQVFNNVKSSGKGGRVYKTGWKRLDKMLQGGFRPGLSMNAALQHKYKTGLNLSLFAQIPRFNRPYTTDPNKKPLILRISFEDEITNNLQFLYQYLKHCETREYIDIGDISAQDMTRYVKEKLQVNGFHVKMMRVDPTQWTYKSICNKIVELEAEGYVIEVLFLDYLAMVPTTGCITSGPMGTDIRDLYRRIRNFCASSRQMVVFTPHQLSTEAKRMIRAGVPEDQFVKEINEKGMFAGSGQLDQECDLIFYTHICKSNGVTYLTFQRDKHRLPTIIADENKYFVLRFPKGMPIPEDRDEEESGFSKVPRANTAQDELFNLG